MINDTKWYNILLFVFRFVFTIFIIINILNWKWTNWLVKEEFKKYEGYDMNVCAI